MFRPNTNRSGGNTGGSFGPVEYVLKPDCGFTLERPTLASAELYSSYRLLPLLDDAMNEVPALVPTGPTDPQDKSTALGDIFCAVQVCRIWDGFKKKQYLLPTAIQEYDSSGNQVPRNRNPVDSVRFRLWHLINTQRMYQQAGLGLQIPSGWLHLDVNIPNDLFLVQALTYAIAGKELVDINGVGTPKGPCVLALPGSALKSFIKDIATIHDDTKPLTPGNCRFGDFITCSGGCRVTLKRELGDKVEYYFERGKHTPLEPGDVHQMTAEWEDILNIPTIEEAIQFLIATLGDLAVDFGLRGTDLEGYIPEDIRGIANDISEPICTEAERKQWLAQANANKRKVQQEAQPTAAPAAPMPPVQQVVTAEVVPDDVVIPTTTNISPEVNSARYAERLSQMEAAIDPDLL